MTRKMRHSWVSERGVRVLCMYFSNKVFLATPTGYFFSVENGSQAMLELQAVLLRAGPMEACGLIHSLAVLLLF